jgi:antitoxin MazE
MEAIVQKWGNSLALRIPKAAAEQLSLSENTQVELVITETEIVIRPARPRYTLEEMLDQITPENIHGEYDLGASQGKEVW